jgi:hypothetical protein
MLGVFGGKEKEELNKKLSLAQEKIREKSEALAQKELELKKRDADLVTRDKELDELSSQIKALQLTQQVIEKKSQEIERNASTRHEAFKKEIEKLKKSRDQNYQGFLDVQSSRDRLKLELEDLKKVVNENQAVIKSELKSASAESAKLKALQESFDKLKAKADEYRLSNETNFKNYQKYVAGQKRDQVKIRDLKQEKELLLLQISEHAEVANRHHKELQELKTANQVLIKRIGRISSGNPAYVDIGGIEILKVDTVSEIPQIIWKIADYSSGEVVLPEFYFRTSLSDGLAGIGLVDNPREEQEGMLFVPQLINKEPVQLDLFKGFSGMQWKQMQAACTALSQLMKSGGQGFIGGNDAKDFDFSFWQSSLITLIENITRLPSIFRYEKVRLKRELQNPDYEHLWLEFHDVLFGDFKSNKLELRVGASMIDPNGFSLLPKLEFPLVDGKNKPFESWFAESGDDFGPKFELRFSLEKQVFDLNTFQKLSLSDQKLLQVLVFALPTAINKLIKSRISIHRPWATWSAFINETSSILLSLTRALQVQAERKVKAVQGSDNVNANSSEQSETRPALLGAFSDKASSEVSSGVLTASNSPKKVPTEFTGSTGISSQVALNNAPVGNQFVPVPTKIIKRKAVSVMVSKNTDLGGSGVNKITPMPPTKPTNSKAEKKNAVSGKLKNTV